MIIFSEGIGQRGANLLICNIYSGKCLYLNKYFRISMRINSNGQANDSQKKITTRECLIQKTQHTGKHRHDYGTASLRLMQVQLQVMRLIARQLHWRDYIQIV
jgi:hypothetical protein